MGPKDSPRRNGPYTSQQRAFLRERIPSGARPVQIAREFNERFDRKIKGQSVRNFALRHGVAMGWKVRMSPGDYGASADKARRCIRKIWQDSFGKIPEGMCVVQTVEGSIWPSTMRLISRGDLAVANKLGLQWSDLETFEAAVAVVRLHRAAYEAKASDPCLLHAHRRGIVARSKGMK